MNLNTAVKLTTSIALVSIFSGCAHQLEIKNLSMYRNTSLMSLEKQARIGIVADTREMEGKRFIKDVADALRKYNIQATTAVSLNKNNLDYIATITVDSEYKGSGWNFLIDWPGFIIFTPAWHGYIYKINHDFNVALTEGGSSNKQIDSFNIPVELDVRHAAFGRTWLAESGWWLLYSIPSAVGGVIHTSYDNNVTPIAHEKAAPVVADFIAQEIAGRLQKTE